MGLTDLPVTIPEFCSWTWTPLSAYISHDPAVGHFLLYLGSHTAWIQLSVGRLPLTPLLRLGGPGGTDPARPRRVFQTMERQGPDVLLLSRFTFSLMWPRDGCSASSPLAGCSASGIVHLGASAEIGAGQCPSPLKTGGGGGKRRAHALAEKDQRRALASTEGPRFVLFVSLIRVFKLLPAGLHPSPPRFLLLTAPRLSLLTLMSAGSLDRLLPWPKGSPVRCWAVHLTIAGRV
ncbi:hypothetical protein K438DRAFT_509463 [Mycena galopus ATCC 62051]|nr:hypothetical protein K438DRAFT_509463 [Mycena galopus ATCC 62051]